MPELLKTHFQRQLEPGDVLMVSREVKPRDGGKPFVWKFFMVVTDHDEEDFMGWVVGASGKLKECQMELYLYDRRNISVYYLPPEEWPDGVHVFRMKMILSGQIDTLC